MLCGGILGASLGGSPWASRGALIGAALLGPAEAITDLARKPGRSKPLAYRIAVTSVMGAVLGALLARVFPGMRPLIAGGIVGALSGIQALRAGNLLLGAGVGVVLGFAFEWVAPFNHLAVVSGAVVLVSRLLSLGFLREPELLAVTAERVPAAEIQYVVPFEANSGYVGAEFFQDLARTEGGAFQRNLPDIGIVETLESLRGPTFDPDQVHPLIEEFYQHTSRFKLHIEPVWRRRMLPLFWLYKRWIAQPIGQANLPFNTLETQRGVVSYIDTIDFQCDDVIDLRGWVRAYEDTHEAIYVGVYTTFRHLNHGYVSVGFPLPASNFTVTLLPYNHKGDGLLLTTRDTDLPYPGHYLTVNEDGQLTVMELPTLNEEIDVYVQDGSLRTDHRFYLGGMLFLTLFYRIDRLDGGAG
jgi:hypothetical protein